jgi:acyl-CoA thioesterase
MGDLAADTQLSGSVGRFSARLSRDWDLGGPSGGYIAAIALRAAGQHSQFGRPVSISGHFLGVPSFDQVIVEAKTLRISKQAESIRVTIKQSRAPIFEALVWTCAPLEGLEHEPRQVRPGVGAVHRDPHGGRRPATDVLLLDEPR